MTIEALGAVLLVIGFIAFVYVLAWRQHEVLRAQEHTS